MTNKKSIVRTTLHYIIFNVISMLGMSLYFLADTYFIANGIGADGLTALNIVLPVFSLITGTGLMLGVGGGTLFSISRGQGEAGAGNIIFTQTLLTGLILGVGYTIIGLLGARPIISLLGANDAIAPQSRIYFITILCYAPAFICNSILNGFTRNDGSPRLSTCAMLASSISNIILDYIFIYPCKLGMFGAALATGISPVVSISILLTRFIRHKSGFRPVKCRISLHKTARICVTGLPTLVTELAGGVVILLFNMAILELAGNTGIAAYGIIANIALVCTAITNGVGQGIQPVVSSCYGAEQHDSIHRAYRIGCLCALCFGLIFTATAIFIPDFMTAVFNRDADPQLAAIAVRGITIYFLCYLAMGINITTSNLLTSIEQPHRAMVISMLRGLVLPSALILTLPRLFAMDGVWLVMPVTEFAVLFVSLVIASAALHKLRRHS